MSNKTVEYVIKLRDSLSPTLKNAGNNVNNFQSQINKVQSPLKGIMGLATKAFAAFAIFDTIKSITKMGADMEQTRVAFTTFIGDAKKANEVLAQLNTFANVTPFDNEQVIKAGKSLLAFGTTTDQLLPSLKAIGDISSATGKDFNELTTIYGKAQVAGTLYAEDINQLIEAGVPVISEFAKQFGTTEDKIKKMASEGKIKFSNLQQAFKDLSGEGGKFNNLMEAQSKTLGGRWSSLVGTLQTVGVGIGESLLEPFGKIVDTASYVVGFMTSNFGSIKKIFAPIGKAVQPIIDVFQKLGEKLGLAGDKGEFLEKVFNTIGNIILFLAPVYEFIGEVIAKVIDVFVEIGEAIYNFIKQNEFVQKTLVGLYTGVVSVFKKIAEAAKSFLGGVGDLIQGIFTADPAKIKVGIAGLAGALKANPINLAMEAGSGFKNGFQNGFTSTDFFKGRKEVDSEKLNIGELQIGNNKTGSSTSSATSKSLGSSVGDISSKKPSVLNITINKLVETLEVNTTNLTESAAKIKTEITKALLTGINDVNNFQPN